MNNTMLINILYLLIPFTLYGVIKFSIWWFKKIWSNEYDILIVMAVGGLNSTWTIYTLIMIKNSFPTEMIPFYVIWTIFAPISLIIGIIGGVKNNNKELAIA